MTFTRSSALFWLDAGAAAGFAPGIVAGFTAGAGAPGAGLAAGAPAATSTGLLSLACFGGAVFTVLCPLLMMVGFCAQAAPVISTTARMPVVSFISDSYLLTP